MFVFADVLEEETSDKQDASRDVGSPAVLKEEFSVEKRPSQFSSISSVIVEKEFKNDQILFGKSSEVMDITSVTKNETSLTNSKRHSPVGDDAIKTFTENDTASLDKSWSSKDKPADRHLENSPSPASVISNKNDKLIDDILIEAASRSLSRGSVGSGTVTMTVESSPVLRSSRPLSVGSVSDPRSPPVSVKDIPSAEGVYGLVIFYYKIVIFLSNFINTV